jgi:hypothetical protein
LRRPPRLVLKSQREGRRSGSGFRFGATIGRGRILIALRGAWYACIRAQVGRWSDAGRAVCVPQHAPLSSRHDDRRSRLARGRHRRDGRDADHQERRLPQRPAALSRPRSVDAATHRGRRTRPRCALRTLEANARYRCWRGCHDDCPQRHSHRRHDRHLARARCDEQHLFTAGCQRCAGRRRCSRTRHGPIGAAIGIAITFGLSRIVRAGGGAGSLYDLRTT